MLSWRTKKQFTVLIILAIIILAIFFRYGLKLLPSPTCFDNRKNQGEFEADCGGPCAPCELKNPKPISIFWARIAKVRPQAYDVATEIENNNEVLSSVNIDYTFTLFEDAVPVAVKKGKTFIFPRERLHIIETNLETTREPTRVEFKINNIEWQFKAAEIPFLAVELKEFRVEEENGIERGIIEARIANRSPFNLREMEVRFVALDEEGNLLGANRVSVENFLSSSQRTVKSIWPKPFLREVAKIEIEPRVNIFDPAVILKPQ